MKEPAIVLLGNKVEAAKWVEYAKKQFKALCKTEIRKKTLRPAKNTVVILQCTELVKKITIEVRSSNTLLFAGIPWDNVNLDGWGVPFSYQSPRNKYGDLIGTPGNHIGGEVILKVDEYTGSVDVQRLPDYQSEYVNGYLQYGDQSWVSTDGEVLSWKGIGSRSTSKLVTSYDIHYGYPSSPCVSTQEQYDNITNYFDNSQYPLYIGTRFFGYKDCSAYPFNDYQYFSSFRTQYPVIMDQYAANTSVIGSSFKELLGNAVYKDGEELFVINFDLGGTSWYYDLIVMGAAIFNNKGRDFLVCVFGALDTESYYPDPSGRGIVTEFFLSAPLDDINDYKYEPIKVYDSYYEAGPSQDHNTYSWYFTQDGSQAISVKEYSYSFDTPVYYTLDNQYVSETKSIILDEVLVISVKEGNNRPTFVLHPSIRGEDSVQLERNLINGSSFRHINEDTITDASGVETTTITVTYNSELKVSNTGEYIIWAGTYKDELAYAVVYSTVELSGGTDFYTKEEVVTDSDGTTRTCTEALYSTKINELANYDMRITVYSTSGETLQDITLDKIEVDSAGLFNATDPFFISGAAVIKKSGPQPVVCDIYPDIGLVYVSWIDWVNRYNTIEYYTDGTDPTTKFTSSIGGEPITGTITMHDTLYIGWEQIDTFPHIWNTKKYTGAQPISPTIPSIKDYNSLCPTGGLEFSSFMAVMSHVPSYRAIGTAAPVIYRPDIQVRKGDMYTYALVSYAPPTAAGAWLYKIDNNSLEVVDKIDVTELLGIGAFNITDNAKFGFFTMTGVL